MRNEYDFSQSRKNPYVKLKRQITIRIDTAAVDYFKQMADELGMPYQNPINLFLRDCAIQKRRPTMNWHEGESEKRRTSFSPAIIIRWPHSVSGADDSGFSMIKKSLRCLKR